VMLGADARAANYQAGDLAGLRWIAGNRSTTRRLYPLTMSLTERFDNGSIVATCSVKDPADPSASFNVALTDDTHPVANQAVPQGEATFRLSWVWPGSGEHLLCVKAQAQGTHSTASGCYRWQ